MCIRDRLCDVLGHRSEQRGQSRGAAHNVESLGGDVRERQSGQRLVEYIGEQLGLIPVSYTHLDVYKRQAAHPAGEAVVTGMRFVITLLILLAFILPIHGNSS